MQVHEEHDQILEVSQVSHSPLPGTLQTQYCYNPTTAQTKSQQEAPTRENTQESTGLAMLSQCSARSRDNRRSQQEKSLKRQQGDGSKREENYGLTGESQHKASSLYTTTCGYVEQTQSKMGTMAMHHMIGSSVAHDGEQGNVWRWTKKTRSRATRIETDTNVKQRSTEMKHELDIMQEPI